MARPALLIGLGGTGQWVLTYVKKELLDYTRGSGVPDQVKLVAFDTTRSIEGGRRKVGDEEPVMVDGVQLGLGEFVHLKGNIEPTVREIVERQGHPHIASWLQARTYLNRLSPGQYILEDGAGQKRPFGRMAVFKDLEANPEASKIFGTLRDAIAGIREQVREDRMLEISIVASLAGGTGAGMAIDIAHLARTVASDVLQDDKFVLRGFFVLPRAFQGIPGGDTTDMRARAFAAVRELGRFLNVFGDRQYPMVYNPEPQHAGQLARPVRKRLFDLCYLVDAQRERNSLDGVEARHGVFPSIADALLAFLDEESGQDHTEHVKNVADGLVDPAGEVAYFSTLGTYSFELPIRDIAEESACRLALEFLNKLLRPEFNDEGRPIRLSASENAEKPGKQGAELASQFLANPGSVEGIRGTLFLQEVARTVDAGHGRNEQLVDAATNRDNRDWLNVIEPDDTTEEVRELRTEVREILEHRLRQSVRSSRELKRKPGHDHERLERDVADTRAEYLGRPQADGTTTGGKLRDALGKYETLQTEKFRQGLASFAVAQLNGASRTDPLEAKGGKLGFVIELLETMADRLDLYVRFLTQVRQRRAQQGRLERQREQAQAARGRMLADRAKTGLLSRAGYRSQEEYLDLMQELLELEKDQMVFEVVTRIGVHLRDAAIALRDELRSWADALVLGTPETSSLLQALGDALEHVRERRERAKKFYRVRKEETDPEYERRLYQLFSERQLGEMLGSVSWRLGTEGEGIELEAFGQVLAREKVRQRDRPTRFNAQLVLGETQRTFHSLVERETIARRLIDLYDEPALSGELYRNGSPLCSTKRTPPRARPANFLAVRRDGEASQSYFDRVVRQLRAHTNASSDDAQVCESAGAHKCTLIWTLDIIDADSLTAYDDLYNAYRTFTDDRRLLHNFPAEVNAVDFEKRLQDDLQLPFRLLNPRIVFLLEHRDWVRQFVRCLVLGLVRLQRDEGENPYYLLELPACELKGARFVAQRVELTAHSTEGAPELLAAMDTFVFRKKDFRQNLEIPIAPAHLRAALVHAERALGSGGAVIEAIEGFRDNGLVGQLRSSTRTYERDLGDLFYLMLKDEIDRLAAV